jgi:DNA-binding FadR family transcriptional regulator
MSAPTASERACAQSEDDAERPDDAAPAPAARLEAAPLRAVRRLTALDTVRARIALAIDLGLLAPGERLPPNSDIAAALDVGEMTVRRALESLCEDGVLVRRRGRTGGTHVAAHPPRTAVVEAETYLDDAESVHAMIDQRLALESGLVFLAGSRVTREQLAVLDRLVERMDAAADWAQFHAADEAFHRALAAAADRPGAAEMLDGVLADLYAYYLPYPVEYLRESNAEHREMVEALRAADGARAAEVCRRHVDVLHRTMFMGLARA